MLKYFAFAFASMEMEAEIKDSEEKTYQCGECKRLVALGPRDLVKCTECGYGILYKPRARTWNQYVAR